MVQDKVILDKKVQNIDDFVLNSITQIYGRIIQKESRRIEWEYKLGLQSITFETYYHVHEDSTEIITYLHSTTSQNTKSEKVLNKLREKLTSQNTNYKLEENTEEKNTKGKQEYPIKLIHVIMGALVLIFVSYSISNGWKFAPETYTTNDGYHGTYTKEDLDKWIRYKNQNDEGGIYLMETMGEIVDIPNGKKATIIKSESGKVKIKIEGEPYPLWTYKEVIQK